MMALSLLSLVFLLVISLVNLVGIDPVLQMLVSKGIGPSSCKDGYDGQRRIAKHLGPDMRVTATADILDERIERCEV